VQVLALGGEEYPAEVLPGRRTVAALSGLGEVSGQTVLVGGAWNALSLLAPEVFTLLISVMVARSLGPEQTGLQSFISFVQFSLILLLATGIPSALTRFSGEVLGRKRPSGVRLLLGWAWRAQIASALVGVAILVGVAFTQPELRVAWMLAAATCGLLVLHAVPSSALIGLQRWRDVTIVGLVTGGVGTAAVAGALLGGAGLTGIFAVEATVAAVNLAWTTSKARRALAEVPPEEVTPRPPWASALRTDMVRYAVSATAQAAVHLVVWRRSEFFFLARYSPPTELAFYSIAFAASSALVKLPQSLALTLLPAVATLFGEGKTDRICAGSRRAMRLLLVLSLPMTAGGIALGPAVLGLVYGDDFRRAGTVVVIMLVVFPIVPLYHLAAGILQGVGRINTLLGVNIVASVVTLTMCTFLVPSNGAVGAAVASAGAQAVGSVLALWGARRALPSFDWRVPGLWRTLLAAAGTGGAAGAPIAILGSGVLGLGAGVVAGALAFVGLALLLRIVLPEDAAWLHDHVGDRCGGLIARLCRPFLPPTRS
jgi:O-antigen/teichoic acid export membrane protein